MTGMCSNPTSGPRIDTSPPVTHDAHDLKPDGATTKLRLDGQAYTRRITRAGTLILTK